MIEKLTVKYSIKIDRLFGSLLLPIVKDYQSLLGDELTKVLLKQHNLAQHLLVVRSVLLLEAGDVMNDFFSHLFSKVSVDEIDFLMTNYYYQSSFLITIVVYIT